MIHVFKGHRGNKNQMFAKHSQNYDMSPTQIITNDDDMEMLEGHMTSTSSTIYK